MVTLCDAMPSHGMVAPEAGGAGPRRSSRSTSRTRTRCTRARSPPGATEINPVADHVHGDRAGSVRDPFGHRWAVATHVRDVPEEELAKQLEEMA